jgi:hypothetical protein
MQLCLVAVVLPLAVVLQSSRGVAAVTKFVDLQDEVIVGVPTAARLIANRADVVAATWATQFRRVLFASLDPVDVSQLTNDSELAARYRVRQIAPLVPEAEVFDPRSTPMWNAIPLLAAMYDECPQCAWFVVADDDSFFVPRSFMHYLRRFNASSLVFNGFGVSYQRDLWNAVGFGATSFAVGGSGYFLSRPLVARMRPLLTECSRHTAAMPWSDARLAICIAMAFVEQHQCRTCGDAHRRCFTLQPYFDGAPGIGVGAAPTAKPPPVALGHRFCREAADYRDLAFDPDFIGYPAMLGLPQGADATPMGLRNFAWRIGPPIALPLPPAELGASAITLTHGVSWNFLVAAADNKTAVKENRYHHRGFLESATWIMRMGHAHPFRGVSFESLAYPGMFLAVGSAPGRCGDEPLVLKPKPSNVQDGSTTFATMPCDAGTANATEVLDDADGYRFHVGERSYALLNMNVELMLMCTLASTMRLEKRPVWWPPFSEQVIMSLHRFRPWVAHLLWDSIVRLEEGHLFTFGDGALLLFEHIKRNKAPPNDPIVQFVLGLEQLNFTDPAADTKVVSLLRRVYRDANETLVDDWPCHDGSLTRGAELHLRRQYLFDQAAADDKWIHERRGNSSEHHRQTSSATSTALLLLPLLLLACGVLLHSM